MRSILVLAFIAPLTAACAAEASDPQPETETRSEAIVGAAIGKSEKVEGWIPDEAFCKTRWGGTDAYAGPSPDWRFCWRVWTDDTRAHTVVCCGNSAYPPYDR